MSTFDFDVIGEPLPPKRIIPAERMETPQGARPDQGLDRRSGQAPASPSPADRGEIRGGNSP